MGDKQWARAEARRRCPASEYDHVASKGRGTIPYNCNCKDLLAFGVTVLDVGVEAERLRLLGLLQAAHTQAIQRCNATTNDNDPSKPHPHSTDYRDGLKDGIEHCMGELQPPQKGAPDGD